MTSFEFLQWEQTTRDTIDLKKIYIDVAGDLVTGVLLSQIIYWNLPNQEGKLKLRVKSDNELWLAKGREQWWDECRISAKQFDRSIKILEKKGIVTTKLKKFDGNPTKHIKLNLDVLIKNLQSVMNGNSNLPKGKKPTSLKGKNDIDSKVKSLTENTTKNTTKIKNNNGSFTNELVSFSTYVNNLSKEEYTKYSESINSIEYFIHVRNQKGFKECQYKTSTWEDIVNDWLNVSDVDEKLTLDESYDLIDKFFETKFKDCDYSPVFYCSDRIKANRYFELRREKNNHVD